MQPLISVIVPVYKAEAFFENCVNSIRNQTYQNLEIILIDDGSPDNCGAMCDEFASNDSRIRVIHKENGGQSTARNAGLDIATGEYIAFVDADDWIEAEMYDHLFQNLVKYNAQISACGAKLELPGGKYFYFNPDYPAIDKTEVFFKIEALRQSIINQKITNSLCDKLFAKEIFSDIRMSAGTIYEDMEIIPKCLEKIEKAVYDPIAFYHYNQTAESTTRGQFNAARLIEADVAYSRVELCKSKYPELYNDAMRVYILVCLSIISLSKGIDSCKQRRQELIEQLQGILPPQAINTLRRTDLIKLKVLRFSPLLFDLMMSIIKFAKRLRGA